MVGSAAAVAATRQPWTLADPVWGAGLGGAERGALEGQPGPVVGGQPGPDRRRRHLAGDAQHGKGAGATGGRVAAGLPGGLATTGATAGRAELGRPVEQGDR